MVVLSRALVGVERWLVVAELWWLWDMNCIGGVIGVRSVWFPSIADVADTLLIDMTADCRPQIVFSFCHTKTLCTIAAPQKTIPKPIRMLVIIAGVDWNWVNVYRIIPGMADMVSISMQVI